MDDRSRVDVVEQTYAAVGRGDFTAVLDLLADDVVWTLQGFATIPFAGTRHGKDGVAAFFTLVGQFLEFHIFEPYAFVAQDKTVVALGRERSLSRSTGRRVDQEWAHVYTFRDEKIARLHAFEDTAALVTAFTDA
jgi:uncharacterized protein